MLVSLADLRMIRERGVHRVDSRVRFAISKRARPPENDR
jgi:hypothetical protein